MTGNRERSDHKATLDVKSFPTYFSSNPVYENIDSNTFNPPPHNTSQKATVGFVLKSGTVAQDLGNRSSNPEEAQQSLIFICHQRKFSRE